MCPKCEAAGTKLWEPRDDMFDLAKFHNRTGWSFVAHNRWWSSEAEYARNFSWLTKGAASLPLTERFWDTLFAKAKKWGMTTFEQDWLNRQMQYLPDLFQNITLGEMWLKQMGRAAR